MCTKSMKIMSLENYPVYMLSATLRFTNLFLLVGSYGKTGSVIHDVGSSNIFTVPSLAPINTAHEIALTEKRKH